MGMCDFPTGYYPPGQLSKIHGNTDRQHLVSRESVQETEKWRKQILSKDKQASTL